MEHACALWGPLGYSRSPTGAHLAPSPAPSAALTPTCITRLCLDWKHLGQALKGVTGLGVGAWGRSCCVQVESQPDPAERPAHPHSRSWPGLGGAAALTVGRVGRNRPGPAKPRAAGCSCCFPGPRWGHGSRGGWAKGREGYSLPAQCGPNQCGRDRKGFMRLPAGGREVWAGSGWTRI